MVPPVSRYRDHRPSERKIVVLVLQSAGEIFEFPAARLCRGGLRRGRRGTRPSRTGGAVALEVAAAAGLAGEHDQLTHVDFRAVASLALLVLPLAVFDSAFDIQFVALLHVLLDDVGELRRFG